VLSDGAAQVLDGDEVGLADQGRVRWAGGDDPVSGSVPAHDVAVAEGGVGGIDEFVVGAPAVPDLPAGVTGSARMARTVFSTQRRASRCGFRDRSAAAGNQWVQGSVCVAGLRGPGTSVRRDMAVVLDDALRT
jgi:hypothetical protein